MRASDERQLSWAALKGNSKRIVLIAGLALVLAILALFSPVQNTASDPHFSLIVSQSLLEEGTLALDAYRESHPELFESFFWQTIAVEGHTYYNYPLAPSLVAFPVVAAARIASLDMLEIGHNHLVQEALSALACAIIFVLVFTLVGTFLNFRAALIIALVSMLGSTLVSTGATAYWNLDVAVIFVLLALILIARFEAGRSRDVHPYLLGLLLFAAYFTRPSAAILILVVFIYLLVKDRAALWRAAVTSFVFFVLFILHSRLTYGLWLPVYYTTSQWFNPVGVLRPLYGVTFSPSRGLFTFSPFFLLVLLGGATYFRTLKHKLLFALCATWLALQLASVALTRQWHGGFSYGPRLLTDAVPALVLMTAILWRTLSVTLTLRLRRQAVAVYLALGLVGVFINGVQGILNVKTALWNAFPNIDEHPELLFDWRYPQFLTSVESFHERRLSFYEGQIAVGELKLAPYEWGETLQPTLQVERALWVGWWPNTMGEWWTETPVTSVVVLLPAVDADQMIVLELTATAPQPRHTIVAVNGQEIGSAQFGSAPQSANFVFDGSSIPMHTPTRITMTVPDLYATPLWTALGQTLSYNPFELGLTNAAIRLVPLSEN